MNAPALPNALAQFAANSLAQSVASEPEPFSTAWRYRETWALRLQLRLNDDLYDPAGYPIPRNIRISCGVSSAGRLPRSTKQAAITYDRSCSTDDTYEIALNPLIDNSFRVAAALGEQFIYIINGLALGRDASFKRIAAAVELRGPSQRMIPGYLFKQVVGQVIDELGPYPHAALTGAAAGDDEARSSTILTTGSPSQKARLIKAQCHTCGLTLRLTQKWIQNRKLSCPDMNCAGHSLPLTIS